MKPLVKYLTNGVLRRSRDWVFTLELAANSCILSKASQVASKHVQKEIERRKVPMAP